MFNEKSADKHKKLVPLAKLRNELFSIESESNQETAELTQKLAIIAATALLVELRDKRKATVEYLSSKNGKSSWHNTSIDEHKAGLQKIAVNDPAESSFGGTTTSQT